MTDLFSPSTKPTKPREGLSFQHLTEMLTEFEIECDGGNHEIKLRRGHRKEFNTFELVYKFKTWKGHDIKHILCITGDDWLTVKTKHDQLVQHLHDMGKKRDAQ